MKMFRYHRGGLKESLATAFEVQDFADMCRKIKSEFPYVHGIYISKTHYFNGNLPYEWGNEDWLVMGECGESSRVVIGMCNFYE